jgi:hypothetical protein
MVDGLSINAADHRQFVHHLCSVREQFADHPSTAAVRGELVHGWGNREPLLPGGHRGQPLAVPDGFGEVRVVEVRKPGLIIP